jgi:hypothetical protein
VRVKIIEMEPDRRRLSLSLKRVEDTDDVRPSIGPAFTATTVSEPVEEEAGEEEPVEEEPVEEAEPDPEIAVEDAAAEPADAVEPADESEPAA